MKEYFNSFDDIQFFHTFSSISRNILRYDIFKFCALEVPCGHLSKYIDSNAKRNTPLYSEFYALQDDIFFEP